MGMPQSVLIDQIKVLKSFLYFTRFKNRQKQPSHPTFGSGATSLLFLLSLDLGLYYHHHIIFDSCGATSITINKPWFCLERP